MCGIVGILRWDGRSVDPTDLDRMNHTLIHRGPDEQGGLTRGSFGMAMRRLSVIDVAGGHQPLSNEDGQYPSSATAKYTTTANCGLNCARPAIRLKRVPTRKYWCTPTNSLATGLLTA